MPTYVVQPGDTLIKIARMLGLRSYRELTGYRSGNPNLIFPGEVLSYGSPTQPPPVSRVLKSRRFASNSQLQAAAENNPSLGWNATGEGVATLQQALVDLGFPMPTSTRRLGRPDGIYQRETMDKVKEFQRINKLAVDGVAGKDTLTRLDQLVDMLDRLRDAANHSTAVQQRALRITSPTGHRMV